MVDCLSPHLLGVRTSETYVFVVGLTTTRRYTIMTDWEPIVVVLVDSFQPLLRGGPPPLPQGIGHHVHVVQGAMSHELVKSIGIYQRGRYA